MVCKKLKTRFILFLPDHVGCDKGHGSDYKSDPEKPSRPAWVERSIQSLQEG